jgi:hypothetical protein
VVDMGDYSDVTDGLNGCYRRSIGLGEYLDGCGE